MNYGQFTGTYRSKENVFLPSYISANKISQAISWNTVEHAYLFLHHHIKDLN